MISYYILLLDIFATLSVTNNDPRSRLFYYIKEFYTRYIGLFFLF